MPALLDVGPRGRMKNFAHGEQAQEPQFWAPGCWGAAVLCHVPRLQEHPHEAGEKYISCISWLPVLGLATSSGYRNGEEIFGGVFFGENQ